MDTHNKNREYISLLMDGEIPDADLELGMAALDTPDGQAAWRSFHRIGDVLRAEAGAGLSAAFDARLAARLAAEPLPARRTAEPAEPAPSAIGASPR